MRLARYVEIILIKFVYHVFNISKLINIYIISNIVTINVLLFDLILKSFSIASRVEYIVYRVFVTLIELNYSRRVSKLTR